MPPQISEDSPCNVSERDKAEQKNSDFSPRTEQNFAEGVAHVSSIS